MLPFIAIVLLTFITSLVLHSNPFSEALAKHDSSMFTYFGYAMENGKIMYTDIFDHKGPIIFIFNYLGILMSTANFDGIYIIEFISLFTFFVFTFKTGKLWNTNLVSFIPLIIEAITLTFFLEGGNLTEEYALPFIAYSLYSFVKFFKNNKKIISYEIILIGISFSIVFLLRANMVSLWLIFCLVILIDFIRNKEYVKLLKVLGLFLFGVSIILIPICSYLYMNNALKDGIFQSLIFNFIYLDTSGERNDAVRVLYSMLSNYYLVMIFSAFLAQIAFKWEKFDSSEKKIIVASILFAILSYYTSVMSGRTYKHYLMPMIPTVTLPLAILLNEIPKKISQIKLICVVSLVIGLTYNIQLIDIYEKIYVTNIVEVNESDGIDVKEQIILNNKNKKANLLEVADVIKNNTEITDEIYVHRKSGYLYLLSDRLSSIKYFNLPAIDLNQDPLIGDDFIYDITHSNTALIAIDSSFNSKRKVGIELEFYNFILKSYDLIYDDNGYSIYLNKSINK